MATDFPPGRPKEKCAPSGGSEVSEATSVGACFDAGPPQGETAPSGGSALHAVKSVGAIFLATCDYRHTTVDRQPLASDVLARI